jgi:hypothetical protein
MRLTLLLCIGLALGSNVLRAGQIFFNFDQGDPNNVYNTSPALSVDPSAAVAFVVPTAPTGFSYSLTDFAVAIQDDQATSIQAALYSNDSSSGTALPGSAIESFGSVALDSTNPLTTVGSVQNPLLISGATYWIVLTDPASPNGALRWYTSGGLFDRQGDAFFSFDPQTEGFDWQYGPGYPQGALQVDADLVSDTPTPEPGTLIALGSGLLLLGARRRSDKPPPQGGGYGNGL